MTLRESLEIAGFEEAEYTDIQWRMDSRYAAIHKDWSMCIAQFWPSDRDKAFWIAGITQSPGYEAKLQYRGTPYGIEGIRAACVQFFQTTDVDWWVNDSPGRFASHPWITVPGDPNDIGVPGILQFLTEMPFVEVDPISGVFIRRLSSQMDIAKQKQAQITDWGGTAPLKPSKQSNPFATGRRKFDL